MAEEAKKAQSEQSSAAPHSETAKEDKEFRQLVRIIDKDVAGNKSIWLALSQVKGVGYMISNAICEIMNLPKTKKVGDFSEAEIQRIEKIIESLSQQAIPKWMLNRRKDLETGEDKHLVGTQVTLQQNLDIRFLRKIRNCRGIKHSKGLRVRGQRSRTTGRRGSTLGVSSKKGPSAAKSAPAKKGK